MNVVHILHILAKFCLITDFFSMNGIHKTMIE